MEPKNHNNEDMLNDFDFEIEVLEDRIALHYFSMTVIQQIGGAEVR